ncbi:MAG: hypothetical protein LBK41_08940 [Clostridiales bacterium]|jgi:hypothetical protein|nr:hypothetical protein [Clostridiales bacterium]
MDDYLYNDAEFFDESFVCFGIKYTKKIITNAGNDDECRKLIREGWKVLCFIYFVGYLDSFQTTLGLPAAIHA